MVCHQQELAIYKQSIHGKSRREKGNDAAGCIDCHGFHSIQKVKSASFRMGMVDTCLKCHANQHLTQKYGISATVKQTYFQDFHGLTVRLTRSQGGDIDSLKPVCHDCHGAHDARHVEASDAVIMKERIVVTCRKCHVGASPSFSAAWMNHSVPSVRKWPLVYFTELAYKILIPIVMGQFGLYILLDLVRFGINRFKRSKPNEQ
jgi:hypothetical protein